MVLQNDICGRIVGDIVGRVCYNEYEVLLTEDQMIFNAGYGREIQYYKGEHIHLEIDHISSYDGNKSWTGA